MEIQEENAVIARIQAGDVQKFEHLVKNYQEPLFRFVANLAGHSNVEDLVQDIFVSAFSHLDTFDPDRASFRTWIYRIARNRVLNEKKKRREILFADAPERATGRTPSDDLLEKEAFERLDEAFGRLPFRERVIFVMAEIEGLSYKQIARVENLALGTVKSRLFRAKERLRKAFDEYHKRIDDHG